MKTKGSLIKAYCFLEVIRSILWAAIKCNLTLKFKAMNVEPGQRLTIGVDGI